MTSDQHHTIDTIIGMQCKVSFWTTEESCGRVVTKPLSPPKTFCHRRRFRRLTQRGKITIFAPNHKHLLLQIHLIQLHLFPLVLILIFAVFVICLLSFHIVHDIAPFQCVHNTYRSPFDTILPQPHTQLEVERRKIHSTLPSPCWNHNLIKTTNLQRAQASLFLLERLEEYCPTLKRYSQPAINEGY
jgi:hypothetical protein